MERRIVLDGCYNFRDLGGYPAAGGRAVRWRALYRSDALHHLSKAEAARLHSELGVVTLIDLRSEPEVTAGDAAWVDRHVVHRFPLIERLSSQDRNIVRERRDRSPTKTAEGYLHMLRTAGNQIAEAMAVLVEDDAVPAVFYCAAGKDRTGVFAAAILGALGVPDETIVEDYVLTSEGIEPIIDRLGRSEIYAAGIEGEPMEVFHPKPDAMRLVLQEINADHGSMADYVDSLGVDVEALRKTFLSE